MMSPRTLLGWLVTERGLRLLGTVPVTILMARSLGPEGFGQLGLALGLAGAATVMAQGGLDRQLRRDLSDHPERAGELIGSALAFTGLGVLLAAGFLHAYALWAVEDPAVRRLVQILAWGILPQFLLPAGAWFQTSGHPRPAVLVRNGALFLFAGLRLWACWLEAGPGVFAWLAAGEWALAAVGVYLLLPRRHPGPFRWRVSGPLVAGWVREGWPMMLLLAVYAVYERLDLLALGRFSPAVELGYYSSAQRFSELFWSLASMGAVAVLPWLVAGRRSSEHEYARRLQLYADVSLAGTVGAALVGTPFAVWGLPLLFGEAFRPSVPVLLWLLWTAPAVFSEMVRSQALLIEKRLGLDVTLSLLHLGVLGVLVVSWVPEHGAEGAAAARFAGFAVASWGLPWLIPATRRHAVVQARAFGFVTRWREMAVILRVRRG